MAAIGLRIEEPVHNTAFTGNQAVTLRGAITQQPPEAAQVSFHFRWYSSVFSGDQDDITQEKFAINNVEGVAITDPGFSYSPNPPLGMGTHVISFAATDQPGETSAEQAAVQHGGVTGGSEGAGQCIIHIFRANLVKPTNNELLSRATSTLDAEAPATWGMGTGTPHVYAPNAEYHKHNRLRYRWQFTPVGAPFNRPPIVLTPAVDELIFLPPPEAGPLPLVRYGAPLPADLTAGYNLTLHVDDIQGVLGGDSMTVTNIQVGP